MSSPPRALPRASPAIRRRALPHTPLAPSTLGDGVGLLSAYVLLLIAIPSRLVLAPLGGAGTPSLLLGCGCALWWVWHRLNRSEPEPAPPAPVRRTVLLFGAAVLASYVHAMARPIVSEEVGTADLGLVALLGWTGVALLAYDGIADRERLTTLLSRLAVAGGALALVGILQFATKESWVDRIDIPGLTANATLANVYDRDGFARPAGTAIHPIEFGVAVTMLLPFALHRAFHSTRLGAARRWWPLLALALAIPLSISRSALIGAVTVLAVMIPAWPPMRRRLALLFVAAISAVVFIGIPGMVGTLTGMFTGIGADSSARSRTDGYSVALEFVARGPVFGRGFSTFLPSYRILDNQYLLLLIEIGVVGLAAMLAMLGAAWTAARRARRASTIEADRHLAQAVAASVAAGAVSLALFDAFSFPMVAGLLFLAVGIAGAVGRIAWTEGVATRQARC